MSNPAEASTPPDPWAEVQARREELRRRLAEDGVTLHIPARVREWQPPEVPFPVSADEASEAVVRMRRGDL